jgi:hypothetical protein
MMTRFGCTFCESANQEEDREPGNAPGLSLDDVETLDGDMMSNQKF